MPGLPKGSGMKKRSFSKGPPNYVSYIHKVLKQVHPDLGISSKAIVQINGVIEDVIGRMTDHGASVARVGKKTTLSAGHVQAAAKMLLPSELAKHAVSEGTKAVVKYTS